MSFLRHLLPGILIKELFFIHWVFCYHELRCMLERWNDCLILSFKLSTIRVIGIPISSTVHWILFLCSFFLNAVINSWPLILCFNQIQPFIFETHTIPSLVLDSSRLLLYIFWSRLEICHVLKEVSFHLVGNDQCLRDRRAQYYVINASRPFQLTEQGNM